MGEAKADWLFTWLTWLIWLNGQRDLILMFWELSTNLTQINKVLKLIFKLVHITFIFHLLKLRLLTYLTLNVVLELNFSIINFFAEIIRKS